MTGRMEAITVIEADHLRDRQVVCVNRSSTFWRVVTVECSAIAVKREPLGQRLFVADSPAMVVTSIETATVWAANKIAKVMQ